MKGSLLESIVIWLSFGLEQDTIIYGHIFSKNSFDKNVLEAYLKFHFSCCLKGYYF